VASGNRQLAGNLPLRLIANYLRRRAEDKLPPGVFYSIRLVPCAGEESLIELDAPTRIAVLSFANHPPV